MYGGLPTSYNPRASRFDNSAPAPAGFDPALKAALAAKIKANSPWPIDPRSAKPAAVAIFDNSAAPAGFDTKSPAELIAEAEALEAKAAALRLRAPWLEARQAATMENRSVQIVAEAREAVRLDTIAADKRATAEATAGDQNGWLTAKAEATAGRIAEAKAKRLDGLTAEAKAEAEAEAESDLRAFAAWQASEAAKRAEPAEVKTAEAGERIKISAVIPADMRKPEHREALAVLEFDLTMQFGGYTVAKARGGWLDGSGDIVRDSSQLYSVSFDPAARDAIKAEAKIIGYFVAAGEALGEEWLHIERAIFTACHRKAN